MTMQNKLGLMAAFTTIVFTSIAISAFADGRSLTYQGHKISGDVVVLNGTAYLPVSDAAKLVGGSVRQSCGAYTIVKSSGSSNGVPAGGANQISGRTGTIGQTLFTGKWKFEVESESTADSYASHHNSDASTVTPTGDNDELVIVNCLMKNAKNKTAQPLLVAGTLHTAVTDNQETSYRPIFYDFVGPHGYGPVMLPGSACNFTVVFDVPKGTTVQDLIFTLGDLNDSSDTSDYRIHLKQ